MPGRINWHGDQITRRLEAEYKRRIKACCVLVANHAVELLSVDGTGRQAVTYSYVRKGVKKTVRKGKLLYGGNPSRPGESPHLQTGHLRRSIATELEALVGRVGTNLLYGRWLELGTTHMAARPWLRRALRECQPQIKAILSAPMKF
jgi:hypothetical protein